MVMPYTFSLLLESEYNIILYFIKNCFLFYVFHSILLKCNRRRHLFADLFKTVCVWIKNIIT